MNVLLIVTDDQGYGDLAFHGNSQVSTPNLDRLASESVEFTRFYVSPVCAPTRASLLTGRYHLRTGTSWVTHRKEVMRSSELTMAEVLKSNDYQTALFGKWHNGKQFPNDPIGQGFDSFLGFSEGHFNNYFDSKLIKNFTEVQTQGYLPDYLTNQALEFMQSSQSPFFCYLSYNTPHSPFQVPDKYFDSHKSKGLDDKNATIYGMIENLDDNIGRIMDGLTSTGLDKNTLVIFMTDNGPNGNRYTNGLKGRKGHVDEGGVRVPFLLKHPAKPELANKKIHDMVAHIDVLPTLADLLDITLPDTVHIDGRSMVPLLNGETPADRYIYTHQVARTFDTIPGAIRSDQLLLTLKDDRLQLYDLLADSTQKKEVTQSNPRAVMKMANLYKDWLEEVTMDGITPGPIEVGHIQPNVVELPAPDVNFKQGLDFKGEMGWANDWFINWTDNSQASWEIKAVADTKYKVLLLLSKEGPGTPTVSLKIGNSSLSAPLEGTFDSPYIESPDRVERGEVYEREWAKLDLGDILIKEGIQNIIITAKSTPQSNLEIKGIKLLKE